VQKKNDGTISELFEVQRVLSKKKISSRKERGKDETLFEVDTYHSNV
jgi:hypothetical protein